MAVSDPDAYLWFKLQFSDPSGRIHKTIADLTQLVSRRSGALPGKIGSGVRSHFMTSSSQSRSRLNQDAKFSSAAGFGAISLGEPDEEEVITKMTKSKTKRTLHNKLKALQEELNDAGSDSNNSSPDDSPRPKRSSKIKKSSPRKVSKDRPIASSALPKEDSSRPSLNRSSQRDTLHCGFCRQDVPLGSNEEHKRGCQNFIKQMKPCTAYPKCQIMFDWPTLQGRRACTSITQPSGHPTPS